MKVEIVSNDDENFKIVTEPVEEITVPETSPEYPLGKTPIPAPLENPKGLGWFDGTSWGTK